MVTTLIVLGLTIAFCSSGSKEPDQPDLTYTQVAQTIIAEYTQQAIANSTLAPTAQPIEIIIAPSFRIIQDSIDNMKEIQWKKYLPKQKGMKVENWTVWVVDVDQSSEDEYKIWVDMDGKAPLKSYQQ